MDVVKNEMSAANRGSKPKLLEPGMILPFALVAMLFPLWGFANDITNPLVRAFKDIFLISNVQSSMVQFAFYLGYGIMAIPAALFIRIYSYKSGILLGLALYALGALFFLPASLYQEFSYFLIALCILTCGLALLETTANPYILSMGHPETATRRLNLAQAFNPLGSITGIFIASTFILNQLQVEEFRAAERAAHPEYANELPAVVNGKLTDALKEFALSDPVAHQAMQAADLATVRGPYIAIAFVVMVLIGVFAFAKLPNTISTDKHLTLAELGRTFRRLLTNKRYVEGVIAQGFYVGAQIMTWTFIIHYGMTSIGLSAAEAQGYNLVAMLVFLTSRFVCLFLLAFIRPGLLLMNLAFGGIACCAGTIFLEGYAGLYSLIGISACMSLMFPTIYGIALKDTGDDASIASAGLVMAIVGGAFMPPFQGAMIDAGSIIGSIPSVKTSFLLPMLSFVVISVYGFRAHRVHSV